MAEDTRCGNIVQVRNTNSKPLAQALEIESEKVNAEEEEPPNSDE